MTTLALLKEKRLSPKQAARLVGVSVASIWRWIGDGAKGRKLKAHQVVGRTFILESDLEAFIAAGNQSETP